MNILLFALLISMQGPVSTGTSGVQGRVLSTTGNPAANIRIALLPVDDGGALIGITRTDSAGGYRMEGVAPGSYYIVAGLLASPTYLPGVALLNTATAVSLTAGSVVNAPDFRLASPSGGGLRVKGRVTRDWLAAGEAVPPLEVRLIRLPGAGQRATGNASTTTLSANVAADGSFEFPSLPPGRYAVNFFPPVQGTNQSVSLREVVVNRDIDDLQLTVPLAAMLEVVHGTLKIDGVAPLFPLQLNLIGKDRPVRNSQFVGDTLSIFGVLVGEYSVKLGDLPQGYSVKSITAGSVDLLTQSFKVTPMGPPPILVTMRVASPLPGVRVVGHITNREGSRLPSNIQISGVVPGLSLLTAILPDGSFEFPMVPPGTYNVQWSLPDGIARTIVVGKDSPTRVDVPLRMPSLRRISLTIVSKSSKADPVSLGPAVWPFLRFVGSPKTPDIRATRAADGNFEFLNVQPGSYEVILEQQGPRGRGANMLSEPVPVVVADKDITVQIIVP